MNDHHSFYIYIICYKPEFVCRERSFDVFWLYSTIFCLSANHNETQTCLGGQEGMQAK